MIGKTLVILKTNPLIIVIMLVFVLITAVSSALVMPDITKMTGIYSNLSDLYSYESQMYIGQAVDLLAATLKILLFSLVSGVLCMIFAAGYGNMLAAALNEGRATIKVFLYGIKKFIGKVVLSALLLMAVMFGFSFVISFITTPVILAGTFGSIARGETFEFSGLMDMQRVIQLVTLVIMTLIYPFIILWFPAIFLDRKESVMSCFRNGIRAGAKRYFNTLPVIAVMMLPTLLLYLFAENIYSIAASPYLYFIYLWLAVILPFAATYFFVVYDELSDGLAGRSV